jgi:hypothetical protein
MNTNEVALNQNQIENLTASLAMLKNVTRVAYEFPGYFNVEFGTDSYALGLCLSGEDRFSWDNAHVGADKFGVIELPHNADSDEIAKAFAEQVKSSN